MAPEKSGAFFLWLMKREAPDIIFLGGWCQGPWSNAPCSCPVARQIYLNKARSIGALLIKGSWPLKLSSLVHCDHGQHSESWMWCHIEDHQTHYIMDSLIILLLLTPWPVYFMMCLAARTNEICNIASNADTSKKPAKQLWAFLAHLFLLLVSIYTAHDLCGIFLTTNSIQMLLVEFW